MCYNKAKIAKTLRKITITITSFSKARDSLVSAKYEKAKKVIEEGISLTEKFIKVDKLADRSEFGWSTVGEYLSVELASNFEDEKRTFRSERRAERRSKQAASRRRSRRGTGGTRSRPQISHRLHLQDLLPRVGFKPGTGWDLVIN